jgi:hypothetical protein
MARWEKGPPYASLLKRLCHCVELWEAGFSATRLTTTLGQELRGQDHGMHGYRSNALESSFKAPAPHPMYLWQTYAVWGVFGLARQLTLQRVGTTHTCFSIALHIAFSLHFQSQYPVMLATRTSQKSQGLVGDLMVVWIGLCFQIFTKYIFDQLIELWNSNISEPERWKPDNFITFVEASTVST